jgi:hypothetical protein
MPWRRLLSGYITTTIRPADDTNSRTRSRPATGYNHSQFLKST